MKLKTTLFAGLLILVAVFALQGKAEARCHKSFSVSLGSPYAPVAVPSYPVYAAPYPYPAPYYDRYVVYPQPVYQPVYVYPPAPVYTGVSFGWSWR